MPVILFGSQTGNAEEIAKLIYEDVKSTLPKVKLTSLNQYVADQKNSVISLLLADISYVVDADRFNLASNWCFFSFCVVGIFVVFLCRSNPFPTKGSSSLFVLRLAMVSPFSLLSHSRQRIDWNLSRSSRFSRFLCFLR
jgi:hypothetical protein